MSTVRKQTNRYIPEAAGSYPARTIFWAAWIVLLIVKVVIATSLPLFGDEAFYWLEGQHLAAAYSDVPGLTAWLARLGVTVAGQNEFGLRWPFLLIGGLLPLLVVRMAVRFASANQAWRAGCWALLLPLLDSLGVLALPDVALTLATLLCLDALIGLRQRPGSRVDALQLAIGLALGALAHYRFGVLLIAGVAAVITDPRTRLMLRQPLPWLAAVVGLLAWWPLVAFNLAHDEAGWRFQLVERHPWAFHADGILQLPIQLLLVTPLLFVMLVGAMMWLWRRRSEADHPWRLIATSSGLLWLGLFLVGFFADRQRVSFHWPLPAYLPLVAVLPCCIDEWRHELFARASAVLAAVGTACVFAFLFLVSSSGGRVLLAGMGVYPDNFGGWRQVASRVDQSLEALPENSVVVADNFMLAAQLAFYLRDARPVFSLDHPLNTKHGRALQLSLFDLDRTALDQVPADRPRLLVIEEGAIDGVGRLKFYQSICEQLGSMPAATTLLADAGAKRFLLVRIDATMNQCITPALADLRAPVATDGGFIVRGWTIKDSAGVASVSLRIDGGDWKQATLGDPAADVVDYWQTSRDPNQPRVGFHAQFDGISPGRHSVGMRLRGSDGSDEQFADRWMDFVPQAR